MKAAGDAARLAFGDCVWDGATRELLRAGESVHLSPKAFQLLSILLEERPKAISKQDLQDRIWPETFVSEVNLPTLVTEVRDAVGDDARDPRFIRTVHGYGYAFHADAVSLVGRPSLQSRFVCKILLGSEEIVLEEGENFIGRSEDSRVWINALGVSRRHARIVVEGGEAVLEDLGSKNGTYRQDRRIERPEELADGDEIRIGPARMTFRRFSTGASTETEERT